MKEIIFHLLQIVPATLRKQAPRPGAAGGRMGGGDARTPREYGSGGGRGGSDRENYRRGPAMPGAGPDKTADAGAGAGNMEFVSMLT